MGNKLVTKQQRKELKTLADDFGLLHMEKVRDIIENCKSYIEGQQGILRVYTDTYLS